MIRMKNEIIHMSKVEAIGDFASLIERVRGGVEILIEDDSGAVALVRAVPSHGGRLLSQSIALAEAHAKELGYTPTLDSGFAADLQEIINTSANSSASRTNRG